MMDPATLCGLAVVALLLLLAMGVPVAVAMGIVGLARMWVVGGPGLALTQLQTLPYNLGADYAFAVVPLFVLMGNLAMAGGLATDLYDAAEKWLRHVRGGLYYTTIIASTAFGAASGSTVVNATVFTRLALPEMLRHGYSKHYSSACICSVGTLATMIPPSVAMVIYAIITEQSLGRLMIAGIIPGVLSGVLYLAMTRMFMRWKPQLAPKPGRKVALVERLIGLKGIWIVDSTSMIIVTLPFLFPMAQAAGLDPIWYGILVIQLVEISAITPPVGMNLFATVSAAQGQVTIEDVIRGISPFVVLSLVILGILIAFPQLALWLPNRMFNQ